MIRFGTSGWRGIVSDDFTFQNVRKVAHSVAGCVKESPEVGYISDEYRQFLAGAAPSRVPTVIVGYDTRFQSEEERISPSNAESITSLVMGGVSMSCTITSSHGIMPSWGSRVVNG